jgi:hypothetical protein
MNWRVLERVERVKGDSTEFVLKVERDGAMREVLVSDVVWTKTKPGQSVELTLSVKSVSLELEGIFERISKPAFRSDRATVHHVMSLRIFRGVYVAPVTISKELFEKLRNEGVQVLGVVDRATA